MLYICGMKTTFIYCLIDPRDNQIRYIGKSNNPEQRLKNHCNPARYRPTYKFNWIRKLKQLKLKPILKILEEVDIEIWKQKEKYWIEFYKNEECNLVNYTDGGDGLSFGNQTSFRKGHIPWNNGTAKPKIIKGNKGRTEGNIKNQFRKNHTPWNTGIKGVKLKPDKNVYQFNKERTIMIRKWNTAKQAAEELNINQEGIGQCARGKSKSCGGYYWNYKNILL